MLCLFTFIDVLMRNTWEDVKCAGERWRESARLIMCERKKCYIESRRKGIFCIKQEEGRLTGLVTSCLGTSFLNMLLKER